MKIFNLLFLSFLKALFDINTFITIFLVGFIEFIIFGILLLIIVNIFPNIATISTWTMIIIFVITPILLIADFTCQKYIATKKH